MEKYDRTEIDRLVGDLLKRATRKKKVVTTVFNEDEPEKTVNEDQVANRKKRFIEDSDSESEDLCY